MIGFLITHAVMLMFSAVFGSINSMLTKKVDWLMVAVTGFNLYFVIHHAYAIAEATQ